MKKLLALCLTLSSVGAFADATGFYAGGGLGYGMQKNSYFGQNTTDNTPAMRVQVGYQFADWVDAELGWNYLTQGGNVNGLGNVSSTIYDFSFTPGFTLPATPVTVFVRLGIDAVSANINSSWYNQIISNSTANFEYGAGVKVAIPETNTFIRGEYINYGSAVNNNSGNMTTSPGVFLIDAAYVF
jgi:hypothetical protein